MLKVTLPNGIVIEGSQDQIKDTLKKLGIEGFGDGTYYYSSSRGIVKITDMHTTHLRNAILRYYQDWVNNLHKITNPRELVNKLIDGIEDKTWIAMIREYSKREEVK